MATILLSIVFSLLVLLWLRRALPRLGAAAIAGSVLLGLVLPLCAIGLAAPADDGRSLTVTVGSGRAPNG